MTHLLAPCCTIYGFYLFPEKAAALMLALVLFMLEAALVEPITGLAVAMVNKDWLVVERNWF